MTEHQLPAEVDVEPPIQMGPDGKTPILTLPTGNDPDDVRTRAKAYKSTIETAFIHLGRELECIFMHRMYDDFGYKTFAEFCEEDLQLDVQRAQRCRRIWKYYIVDGRCTLKELAQLGYYNALTLVGTLKRLPTDQGRNLIETAIELPSTRAVDELRRSVNETDDEDEYETETVSADGTPVLLPAVKSVRNFALYKEQDEIVQAAIDEAERISGSSAPNELLAHICTEFVQSRMTKEEKPILGLKFLLSNLERAYGGRFIHIDSEEAIAVLDEAIEKHPNLFPHNVNNPPQAEEISYDTGFDDTEDGSPF